MDDIGGVLSIQPKGLLFVKRYVLLDVKARMIVYAKTAELAKNSGTRKILLSLVAGGSTATSDGKTIHIEVNNAGNVKTCKMTAPSADEASFWAAQISKAAELFVKQDKEKNISDEKARERRKNSKLRASKKRVSKRRSKLKSSGKSKKKSVVVEADLEYFTLLGGRVTSGKVILKKRKPRKKSSGVRVPEQQQIIEPTRAEETEDVVKDETKVENEQVEPTESENEEEPKSKIPTGKAAATAMEKMIEGNMLKKKEEVYGLHGKKIPSQITKPFLPAPDGTHTADGSIRKKTSAFGKSKRGGKKRFLGMFCMRKNVYQATVEREDEDGNGSENGSAKPKALTEREKKEVLKERMAKLAAGAGGGQYNTGLATVQFGTEFVEMAKRKQVASVRMMAMQEDNRAKLLESKRKSGKKKARASKKEKKKSMKAEKKLKEEEKKAKEEKVVEEEQKVSSTQEDDEDSSNVDTPEVEEESPKVNPNRLTQFIQSSASNE